MYFTNIKYWCLYLLHDNKWYNCYSYAKIENLSRDIRFCYPSDILENLGFSGNNQADTNSIRRTKDFNVYINEYLRGL